MDSDLDRSKHSQCENPLNEQAGHEGMKSVSSDAMIEQSESSPSESHLRNLKKILKAFLPHNDVLYDSVLSIGFSEVKTCSFVNQTACALNASVKYLSLKLSCGSDSSV